MASIGTDNLGEPEPLINQPSTIIGLITSFTAVTWICVIFRMYARVWVVRAPGWDDLFVCLYVIFTTAGNSAVCISTRYGMGKHIITLTADQIENYLKCYYVANATFPVSAALIKISLLFQYMRVFKRGTRTWTFCAGMIGIIGVWGLVFALLGWVPAVPIAGFWDLEMDAHRYGYSAIMSDSAGFVATYTAHSFLNVFFDIVVFAIPFKLWFEKSLDRRARMGLMALFVMGAVVVFVSIWRLESVIEHRAATLPVIDPTWYGPLSITLACIEVELAAITACIPIFWPVLVDVSHRLDHIFITREVKIERANRQHGERLDDDSYELGGPGRTSSSRDLVEDGAMSTTHSRAGSQAELKLSETTSSADESGVDRLDRHGSKKGPLVSSHYQDDFIAAQVDPFSIRAPEKGGGVQSVVQSESGNSLPRKKHRFL